MALWVAFMTLEVAFMALGVAFMALEVASMALGVAFMALEVALVAFEVAFMAFEVAFMALEAVITWCTPPFLYRARQIALIWGDSPPRSLGVRAPLPARHRPESSVLRAQGLLECQQ